MSDEILKALLLSNPKTRDRRLKEFDVLFAPVKAFEFDHCECNQERDQRHKFIESREPFMSVAAVIMWNTAYPKAKIRLSLRVVDWEP